MKEKLYLVTAQLFKNSSIGHEAWINAKSKTDAINKAYNKCPKSRLLDLKHKSTWEAITYDIKQLVDWETISIALSIIEKGLVLIENAIPHDVENNFSAEFYNIFLQSFGELVCMLPEENIND